MAAAAVTTHLVPNEILPRGAAHCDGSITRSGLLCIAIHLACLRTQRLRPEE